MHKITDLPWQSPLELARSVDATGDVYVLLYSGLPTAYSGRRSFLAFDLAEHIHAADFDRLESVLSTDKAPFENAWFGYLGYGLKNCLENLTADATGSFSLPALQMARFRNILAFDHQSQRLEFWSEDQKAPDFFSEKRPVTSTEFTVNTISSNMSREEYLEKVNTVLEHIRRGNVYQSNLTRKFFGSFDQPVNPLSIFERLSRLSPAPYSAFLKFGSTCILSSSPEQFLTMDAEGRTTSRPIKGTISRSPDRKEDEKLRGQLAKSAKDRAENLMIVDLMRNDFSRGAMTGSIKVDDLFEINSFATIHHMASTVRGRRRADISPLSFVKNCFPPGSMTGTPKIRAMELCSHLEGIGRGVYSGAIGWFGGDGSIDLSVVIRTLLIQNRQFEFQVGGGIVADSTPEGEWLETLAKTQGIIGSLGVDMEKLRQL